MRHVLRGPALAFLLTVAPIAAQAASPVSSKLILSAAGPSAPVSMNYRTGQGYSLPPGILVSVSSGASLTYSIEVTGDQPDAYGNFASTATWVPLDSTAVGQTATGNFVMSAMVTAMRANVTSYTSGTLTFEVVQ